MLQWKGNYISILEYCKQKSWIYSPKKTHKPKIAWFVRYRLCFVSPYYDLCPWYVIAKLYVILTVIFDGIKMEPHWVYFCKETEIVSTISVSIHVYLALGTSHFSLFADIAIVKLYCAFGMLKLQWTFGNKCYCLGSVKWHILIIWALDKHHEIISTQSVLHFNRSMVPPPDKYPIRWTSGRANIHINL